MTSMGKVYPKPFMILSLSFSKMYPIFMINYIVHSLWLKKKTKSLEYGSKRKNTCTGM